MQITVFTSNQPRHLSLIRRLAEVADKVLAIEECNTVFPGRVEDFFKKSPVMQRYFSKVIAAEKSVFGELAFSGPNVSTLSIKSGDLNLLDVSSLGDALRSDIFIVFGASWIRPPLIEILVEKQAVNIHMGVSPYYRGNSCNFWALYDGRPELVGATIHRLSRGLDSGGMLFHALPDRVATDPFVFGMKAVEAAHVALLATINSGEFLELSPVPQDRSLELRYTRNRDFNDEVAAEFLSRELTSSQLGRMLREAPERQFLRPIVV